MALMNLSVALAHPVVGITTGRMAGSLALWQVDSINSGNSKLLMLFVAVAAFALLAQAVIFGFMAFGAMKAQKRIAGLVSEMHAVAMPVLQKSHGLLTEMGPKVSEITENVMQISGIVRDKVVEFEPTISAANVTLREANLTAQDVNLRARGQVARVDSMITTGLNAVGELAGTVHHGLRVPLREMSAVVGGFKVGLETLIGRMKILKAGVASSQAKKVPPIPRETEYAKDRADMHDLGL